MDGDVGAAARAAQDAPVHAGILRPIAGEDRAGKDPRYEEEFEQIENEVAKIGAVEQLEVDWPKVETLAVQLLTETSKDLRCVCWWAIARVRQTEFAGLREGVATFIALLEQYKGDVFPRRPKARLGAIAWYTNYLDGWLKKYPQQATRAEVDAISDAFARAADIFDELEVETAELHAARESLGHIKLVASEEEREEEVRKAFPEGYEDLGMSMLQQCGEPGDNETPMSLRMRRWALWMASPDVVADNRRDVTTAREVAEELASLYGAHKWTDLLVRCEKLFMTSPFWLDLSFWSAKAATQLLGEEAKLAIVGELRALVTRDPNLVTAADREGGPLLCDEARDWVEHEVAPRSNSGNGDESASIQLPPELRQLLEVGQLREAMVTAQQWINVSNGRVRFARSVALANAFMNMGAAEQSFLVFRGLHSQLRQMTVKEWEPRLFAACLEGYLSSKKVGPGLGMEDEPPPRGARGARSDGRLGRIAHVTLVRGPSGSRA